MKHVILLLIVGMLLTGCSSVPTRDIQIETQADPKVNFAGYETYSWLGSTAIFRDPSGQWEPPAFDADAEIKYLIDRELRKKGLLESSADPDLVVAFALGVDTEALKLKIDPKTERITLLEDVAAGELIVAFIDPSSGFVVWAGAATAELLEKPDTETAKARLDYVITRMLKKLPKK